MTASRPTTAQSITPWIRLRHSLRLPERSNPGTRTGFWHDGLPRAVCDKPGICVARTRQTAEYRRHVMTSPDTSSGRKSERPQGPRWLRTFGFHSAERLDLRSGGASATTVAQAQALLQSPDHWRGSGRVSTPALCEPDWIMNTPASAAPISSSCRKRQRVCMTFTSLIALRRKPRRCGVKRQRLCARYGPSRSS